MGKYKTYPEYQITDISGLEELPSHWNTKQIRYLLKDGAEGIKIGPFGSALKLEDMVENGIFVFGQENVIKKNFLLGKRRISDAKFKEMEVYKASPGDILITMMGTSGKCEIVPEAAALGIIDSHLLRLRVREDLVKSEFFKLLIDESPEVAFQIRQQGKGSIMHGLNSSIVKSLFLPLPDIEEQSTILSFLTYETAKIDTLIEKQQQLIKLLKEKRQAVISHAVTKGLNPQAPMKNSGVEWLGEVPEHWVVSKLKYFSSIQGGFAFSSDSFVEEGIQILRIGNVYQNRLALERQPIFVSDKFLKELKDYHVTSGDLLMSLTGTLGKRDYGFAVKVDTHGDFLLNQRVAKLLPFKDRVSPDYLIYVLWSDSYLTQLYSLPSGTKQANLANSDVLGISIAIPPSKEEQKQIANYLKGKLSTFDSTISKAEAAIKLMQERRTALISAAVTGKIDVRNWQSATHQDQALEQTA